MLSCVQIPGRSGDACIPGGGSYVDDDVGGCGSTGNGDLHIRFQLCFLVRPVHQALSLSELWHVHRWSTRLPCSALACVSEPCGPNAPVIASALLQIVELMRNGASPQKAAEAGITRIAKKYPEYVGAAFAVDASGKIGAACFGWTFKYAVRDNSMSQAELREVKSLIL